MASGYIQKDLVIEIVSDMTNQDGIIVTDIPYSKFVSAAVNTSGINYFAVGRQSNSGTLVIFIFGGTMTAIINTQVEVKIIRFN